jgi:AraC family transcriptional regulator of adaptative response/methylated-DNA-[protein]-cysteine methyltransferase
MAITAVRTTKIFCREGCPARPNPENTVQYDTGADALLAGYRPCKRCHPLHEAGRGPARDAPVAWLARIDTPLGPMLAAVLNDQLVLLEFGDRRMVPTQFKRLGALMRCTFAVGHVALHDVMREQLAEFFAGGRTSFDLPVATPGTPFQQSAWQALQRIPSGKTRSYAEQAVAIGRPAAVRAVARANGDNRIAIVIPCHRVIGSDGSLTGYGGGIWRKKALLEIEAGSGGKQLLL